VLEGAAHDALRERGGGELKVDQAAGNGHLPGDRRRRTPSSSRSP
jgi:hypothetical protein